MTAVLAGSGRRSHMATSSRTRPRPKASEWVLDGPWEASELIATGARLLVAGIGLLAAYIGCSGTVSWLAQQAWTALGIGALVFGLTAVAGWIQSGLRTLRALEAELLGMAVEEFGPNLAAETVPNTSATRPDALVTVAGTTLLHRPSCLLVAGKPVREISRTAAVTASLADCTMCIP